jgi:hypothetical protein
MPARRKTVKVETRSERVLNFGKRYSFSDEDTIIRLRNEGDKLIVIAPCGEERELDEEQASLVDDVLSLLNDVMDNEIISTVYDTFNEAYNEI